jgi:hypothetical protein
MTKRIQSMVVDCHDAKARSYWADSSISFYEYDGAQIVRRVTVNIKTPAELYDIRLQLQSIEDGWRSQLESIKP